MFEKNHVHMTISSGFFCDIVSLSYIIISPSNLKDKQQQQKKQRKKTKEKNKDKKSKEENDKKKEKEMRNQLAAFMAKNVL